MIKSNMVQGVYLIFIWKCLFELRKCVVMRVCVKCNEHKYVFIDSVDMYNSLIKYIIIITL